MATIKSWHNSWSRWELTADSVPVLSVTAELLLLPLPNVNTQLANGTSQFAHISFGSGIPAPVGMPGEPYESTSWYALADVVPPRLAAVGYLWMKGMFDLSQLFVYMLPQSLRRGCGVTHTATWLSLCLCPSVSSGFTHRVSSFCGVFRHSRRHALFKHTHTN